MKGNPNRLDETRSIYTSGLMLEYFFALQSSTYNQVLSLIETIPICNVAQ